MKVLIVDDYKLMRQMLSKLIQKNFLADVYEAENGLNALELLENGLDIDILFLDVLMPKMGAQEFLPEFVKMKQKETLHLVIMSGFTGNTSFKQLRSLAPGIKVSCLEKPFSLETLANTIGLSNMIKRNQDG